MTFTHSSHVTIAEDIYTQQQMTFIQSRQSFNHNRRHLHRAQSFDHSEWYLHTISHLHTTDLYTQQMFDYIRQHIHSSDSYLHTTDDIYTQQTVI